MRQLAEAHALSPTTVEQIIEPYRAWITAADARDAAERLTERDRLAIALVALANQERALALETRAARIAPPATVQMLLHNADAFLDTLEAKDGSGIKVPPTVCRFRNS